MNESLKPLGPIVGLQVQTDHLKLGQPPARRYDPTPVTAVAGLDIDRDGVTGILDDGTVLLDVHHRHHPRSRHRGDNGVSLGFSGHYRAIGERFARVLPVGAAGENLIIDDDRVHDPARFYRGVVIDGAGGRVRLTVVIAAPPCVEFTRYCLGLSDGHDREPVTAGLEFLGGGMRGFYAELDGETARVRPGDMAYAVT